MGGKQAALVLAQVQKAQRQRMGKEVNITYNAYHTSLKKVASELGTIS